MQISIETKGTAGEILDALELCMKLNSRKQVFHAMAEKGGRGLIAAPESEIFRFRGDYSGFCGIHRHAWKNVPGYREKIAGDLAAIMQYAKNAYDIR